MKKNSEKMIAKMIQNLKNKMEKIQESINKGLEEIKNKHTEKSNTLAEIKTTLSSVAQSCSTLCHHMVCSMPDFFVHYKLLELAQTHVH